MARHGSAKMTVVIHYEIEDNYDSEEAYLDAFDFVQWALDEATDNNLHFSQLENIETEVIPSDTEKED